MQRETNQSTQRRQRGSALIEFALCSSVLLLVGCGITDFARAFTVANLATGAASAGVQYGVLSSAHYGDLTGMQDAALADTGNYTGATATATQFCTCSVGGEQVSCPATCGTSSAATYVQVVVVIPYRPMFSYPGLASPINLTHLACARVQ